MQSGPSIAITLSGACNIMTYKSTLCLFNFFLCGMVQWFLFPRLMVLCGWKSRVVLEVLEKFFLRVTWRLPENLGCGSPIFVFNCLFIIIFFKTYPFPTCASSKQNLNFLFFISSGLSQIAFGQHHVMVLDSAGQVYSIGRHDYGRLGLGAISKEVHSPTMVEGLGDPATEIGCGTAVSFAVTNTGNAFSWGMGNNGQVILN